MKHLSKAAGKNSKILLACQCLLAISLVFSFFPSTAVAGEAPSGASLQWLEGLPPATVTGDGRLNSKEYMLRLRLRTPGHLTIRNVTLNGEKYSKFNGADESIDLSGASGVIRLKVEY